MKALEPRFVLNATSVINPLGQLVISAMNPGDQFIASGTVGAGATDVVVNEGVSLGGDGEIIANTILNDGATLSPGDTNSDVTVALTVDSLQMLSGSLLEVDLNGSLPGVDHDQIVINATDATDGAVEVDGALLSWSLGFAPNPGTEFVLIDNDGIEAITGLLQTNLDVDGSTLANPRTLSEGDLLFSTSSGAPQNAFITYAGGDGNDLAIVTADDLNLQSLGVTIVNRDGDDLHIRRGTTTALAQAATPTVQSIETIADLNIMGTSSVDDVLIVDVDQWFDTTVNATNFSGRIQFDGLEQVADHDRLLLQDSNLSNSDGLEFANYSYTAGEIGSVTVRSSTTGIDDLRIDFSRLESIEQTIVTDLVDVNYSRFAEQIEIGVIGSGANELNSIQASLSSVDGTLLSLRSPAELLTIGGGNNNDTINLSDVANDFRAAIRLEGDGGFDEITSTASLQLGSGSTTGSFNAIAERVRVAGSIDTTGGMTDGDVQLVANTSIIIDSGATINTDTATIHLDANNGTIDTSDSLLQSNFGGDAILIQDAGLTTLGNIRTPNGNLQLGISQDINGAISQASATSIVTDRLTVSARGLIDLSGSDNEVRVINGVRTFGDFLLTDSSGDLSVSNIGPIIPLVDITASGSVLIFSGGISASGGEVNISSGGVIDASTSGNSHIIGRTVNLVAASDGIGQTSPLSINAQSILNVDTTADNSDVNIINPGREIKVGLINAGSGNVVLAANSIEDATTDTIGDIIANQVDVQTGLGFGRLQPIELQSVTSLNAALGLGMQVNWDAAGPTSLNVSTGIGDIVLQQSGSQTLNIVQANSTHGNINIENVDGGTNIHNSIATSVSGRMVEVLSAGPLNIEGVVESTGGSIVLQSDLSATIANRVDSTVAFTSGSITVDAPRIVLDAAILVSRGGNIVLSGDTTLQGTNLIDSGDLRRVSVGGDINLQGTLAGTNGVGDSLQIDARGTTTSGDVTVTGAVGGSGVVDPNGLTIHAARVQLNSTSIAEGNLLIEADVASITNLAQTTGSGDIRITQMLELASDTQISAAGDATLGTIVAQNPGTTDLLINATGNITLGSVSDFVDATITSGNIAHLNGAINVSGELNASGSNGIVVSAPTINTIGQTTFTSDVTITADFELRASSALLLADISIEQSTTAQISAPLAEDASINQTTIAGAGVLVLTATSTVSHALLVSGATLRVSGAVGASSVTVDSTGRLEGNGTITAPVLVQNGGTIAPGNSAIAADTDDALQVESITLAPGSIYEVQFNGPIAGLSFDQTIIDADLPVHINGATLDWTLGFAPAPATEFVLLDNAGSNQIVGEFQTFLNTDGTQLSNPRILHEGDLVFSSAGGTQNAFITYFGGDGNDVAIVTSGSDSVQNLGITIVERSGFDLQIRTGNSLAAAQNAAPTVRPIAGLNVNELRIDGTANDDLLIIDTNSFVDPTLQTVNFNGTIRFDGGIGGNDQILFWDSDESTNDTLDAITYDFAALQSGSITVDPISTAPNFDVLFSGVESIDAKTLAIQTSVQTSDNSELISIDQTSATQTRLEISSGGDSLQLSTTSPSQAFSLRAGAGNDEIQVNSLAPDFRSALVIEGQLGNDSLTVDAPLLLGNVTAAGDVFLSAENLRIDSSINTTAGDQDGRIQLIGGSQIVVNGDISSGSRIIEIDGNSGSVDTSVGQLTNALRGNAIIIGDASTVILGDVNTLNGRLVLGESQDISGAVTQAAQTTINIDQLAASTNNRIELGNIDNSIRLINGILSRGDVTVNDSVDDLSIENIVSTNGDISISTRGSALLSNLAIDSGSANVTINAGQGIEDADADESSVNVVGADVILTAGSAAGIGQEFSAVDIRATGSISADTTSANANISISNSAGELPIGLINAGTGLVTLDANQIDDASDDSIRDIVASEVVLVANNGIGSLQTIELRDVQTLDAATNSGGVHIDWTAASNTTARQLIAQSGDITLRQRGGQELTLQNVANANNDVTVINEDASIVTESIDIGSNASATIIAEGPASNILVEGLIASGTGSVNLVAGQTITFQPTGEVTSADGSITIEADRTTGQNGGIVDMLDGALINAGLGTVEITTDGDIRLGGIVSRQSDFAVALTSDSGQITDNGDQHLDIDTNGGEVVLRSATGIGFLNRLETAIDDLTASSGTGSIEIQEFDNITLRSIVANDGAIEILANGSVEAIEVLSMNEDLRDDPFANGDADSRDIRLMVTGATSNIFVANVSAMNDADVFLIADNDILDTDATDSNRVVADDLYVQSGNATADTANAIDLSTAINELEAIVLNPNRGDIEIRELDSIVLAASDRADDSEQVITSNGEIRVFAGNMIHTIDPDLANEGLDRLQDPELVAGGENGRVLLDANDAIEIANGVAVHADQSTIQAVVIRSGAIVLGEEIEINTGNGVGVARVFSPRPDFDLIDTSFFDFTTVSTNVLEQAAINDAEGILTVDIGSEGERGLTINIDWGAETARFQQIDGLSGDAPPLQVQHLYLENDILESRVNGRTSATKPIEVRFSVRHHESILVLGSTVVQAQGEIETVLGNVVSSTDNPLTFETQTAATLENGETNFIIPSLSIPVAFFPVRDVIPEIEEPEFFVTAEQSTTVTTSTLQTTEVSVSSSTSREEYFQIRVLSPDPNGEDLAPPERLPDDVLDGDKLRQLFSQLPDGQYEIEYVLGDGNERSILKVDLRDGKPTVPGDDLDGGQLRLRLLDSEESTDLDERPEPKLDSLRTEANEDVSPESKDAKPIKRLSVAERMLARRFKRSQAS